MSTQIARHQEINNLFESQKMMILKTIGDKTKANKFIATAVKVATDYKLANCNTNSIVDACIAVAQLDLDLTPALGHAYIVPFKGSVQLIVSARGYTALLARTGWKLKSYIVNEDDFFEYNMDGFDETIKFKKNLDSENEVFRYAVALALSPDGTLYIEIMNKKQIEKHRLASSNQNSTTPTGIWKDWYEQMALKTVVKKLVKKLPIGEEIAFALEKDDKTIEAEITNTKQLNLNQIAMSPEPEPERDLLENFVIDRATGEVYKPNLAMLDNVNPDGTDREDE